MVTLTPGDGTASPGTRVWAQTQEFVDSVRSYTAFQKRSPPLVSANDRNVQSVSLDRVGFSEGDHLLQALNGFVLVVTTDGTVFYASRTIQDFLGFHQSDVLHQSVLDLVHMDDREMFRCQLHFALNPNDTDSHVRAEDGQQSGSKCPSSSLSLLPQYIPPENSSFLERSFCCRLRCLLDNTSGFLALNFTGHLKYLHLQGNTGADGSTAPPPHLALFAIATPVQPPSVMEIRTKTLIFQTKHSMDFAPVGIDTRGKLVLGYSEIELVTTGSGYQFIHAADMIDKDRRQRLHVLQAADQNGHWLWVQANARIVFKDGRPDFIIARQKALTNEEGGGTLAPEKTAASVQPRHRRRRPYDTWMDSFSIPGPPGSVAHGTSLPGQPRSAQRAGPGGPGFTEEVRHGGPHIEAMIDSLEQILADIGGGGFEDLQVEETELRDWENTVVNEQRKGRRSGN
ncbi:Aryl hydrocarbon receptor [Larimichthys crocea]|uniref:Aryl hydrocarbon receptor n=1 Tax=Larimichthys crocea TaxID=215358 RepID=A0A6G0I1X5_LARCR|nr:Aryl hydrocarbon receptor [Larimichthys crocea]